MEAKTKASIQRKESQISKTAEQMRAGKSETHRGQNANSEHSSVKQKTEVANRSDEMTTSSYLGRTISRSQNNDERGGGRVSK